MEYYFVGLLIVDRCFVANMQDLDWNGLSRIERREDYKAGYNALSRSAIFSC